MSELNDSFVEKLAQELGVSFQKLKVSIKNVSGQSTNSTQPEPKPTKQPKSPKTLKSHDSETVHYCEWVPRGKGHACGSEDVAKEKTNREKRQPNL